MGPKYQTLCFCESSWSSWRAAPRELRFRMAKALGALWSLASLEDRKPGVRNSFGTGILSRLLESLQFVKYGVRVVYGTFNKEIHIDTLTTLAPVGGGGGDGEKRDSNIKDFNIRLRISQASASQKTVTDSVAAMILENNLDRFAYWLAFVFAEDGNSTISLSYCGYVITISSMMADQNNLETLDVETDLPEVGSLGDQALSIVDSILRSVIARDSENGEQSSNRVPSIVVTCIHDRPSVSVSRVRLSPAMFACGEFGSDRLSAFELLRQRARSRDLTADLAVLWRSIIVLMAKHDGPSVGMSGTRLSPAMFACGEFGSDRLSAFELLRHQLLVPSSRTAAYGNCSVILLEPSIGKVDRLEPVGGASSKLSKTGAALNT